MLSRLRFYDYIWKGRVAWFVCRLASRLGLADGCYAMRFGLSEKSMINGSLEK